MEDLVIRVRNGDKDAYGELIELVQSSLLRTARIR